MATRSERPARTARSARAAWRAALLPALALLSLLAGYAVLARGGTTAGAVLLAVGYCALLPLALLRAGRAPTG